MNRYNPIDEISAILTERHYISFNEALALQQAFGERDDITFEDFLIEEGVVDKSDLLEALSQYYGVPQCDVVGIFFDHYLMRLFPKDILLNHLMIPYQREGDTLWVVAAEPNDPHILVVLGNYISHDIAFMVGIAQDIRDAIREYYDQSDRYQPDDIANQQMERSAQEVHTPDELDPRIPHIVEETVDDYESK